jgi:hypothetical protein
MVTGWYKRVPGVQKDWDRDAKMVERVGKGFYEGVLTMKMECEREEPAFMRVKPTERFLLPASMRSYSVIAVTTV